MTTINSETTLEFPQEVMLTTLDGVLGGLETWYLQSLDRYGEFPHKYDERTFAGPSLESCQTWLKENGYVSKYGEFSGDFTFVRKEN